MGAINGQSIRCFGIREGQANPIFYSISSFFSAGWAEKDNDINLNFNKTFEARTV